jgi:hypothetical protein
MLGTHEQMCAMENLRVWEEEETGGKLATIHYSAQYREGYMKFYLNDAKWPIVVKDEGHKHLRIRGLRIQDNQYTLKQREENRFSFGSRKTISVRIDFANMTDKKAFIGLILDAQKDMVEIE